ncbi:MAG TPA: HEAT repeat domain-containing protein [Thermoguttaceae bacterium]|nr:HEAT repeat domain-containing protein [Thermoguttaceae bacterium]
MGNKFRMIVGLLVAVALLGLVQVASADEALDKAMEELKAYDWGTDRAVLNPIDQAVAASHGDAAAQKALEAKLAGVLGSDATRAAKDFVCRQLSLIGSADSVPALAALLPDEKLSHMGRYALERMGGDAAAKALRDALAKVGGLQKVGVINSLGVLRDADATGALTALLADSDAEIASAAAAALGSIGTSEAAKALGDFQKSAPEGLRPAAADACLTCAERMLAAGNKAEAMMIYKTLSAADQPKHVRLAAMRGMLAATGKN